jgi:hypothetical protein
MAAISTSHGVHGSMSFNSTEAELTKSSFQTMETKGRPSPIMVEPQPSRVVSPGPLPLPNFVFPARSPPASFSSSAPSSFSRGTGRKPLSEIMLSGGTNERSSTADGATLPDFSFGGKQSPSLSPPPRSSHKRTTSELDGKSGSLPSPPPLGVPGRKGHQHRRSAAISCHDLSMILKPGSDALRGSSAPNTPSASSEHHEPFPGSIDSTIQSEDQTPEAFAKPEDSPTKRTFNRNRVDFSDHVQIIPRPLSLVSSDSASTVRPGHSVSNSMSSIISVSSSSPASKEKRGIIPSSRVVSGRPRTAEPILDQEVSRALEPAPKRRSSLPLLSEVAAASSPTPSTPRSAKKWSFFSPTGSGESSPKSRPTSASSGKESKKLDTAPSSPDIVAHDVLMPSIEPSTSRRSSISRKPSKKQKKVKSWAGSILSRKSRQRSQKKLSRRSPTPPLRTYQPPMDESSNFDFNEPERPSPPKPELQTDFASWKPRKLPPQEESMSPIIDLDAALGPFNTPSSFGDDWSLSQRGGTKKRAMHSAAGLGGFTGPGMHYHRRAESAPEFENPRFGLHRLGSSSTMAMEDVFEEDEDEEWEDTKGSSDKESTTTKVTEADDDDRDTGLGIDIKVVDSESMNSKSMDFDDATFQRGVKRKGSGLSEGERRQMSSTKSIHSTASLLDEPIQEESGPVEIVDDAILARPDSRAQSSDSTATPPFRPRPAKDLAPVDIQSFSLQPPYPTPTSPRSTTQSSFPSPRSPFSYDAQRISTAPSSITDENTYHSLLLGEPGPELRMSVDDVPSLTSSNSTMTREIVPNPGSNPQFRDGQRSASLSSAAVTRKRSSMASLSRLISSSHGERSKLSIESRPSSAIESEKKEKGSKSKRISRMMQFWKPKDSSS